MFDTDPLVLGWLKAELLTLGSTEILGGTQAVKTLELFFDFMGWLGNSYLDIQVKYSTLIWCTHHHTSHQVSAEYLCSIYMSLLGIFFKRISVDRLEQFWTALNRRTTTNGDPRGSEEVMNDDSFVYNWLPIIAHLLTT